MCYPAQRNLVERLIEKIPSGIKAVYGNPHVHALERLVEHQIAGVEGGGSCFGATGTRAPPHIREIHHGFV